jgi:hypothetical protein
MSSGQIEEIRDYVIHIIKYYRDDYNRGRDYEYYTRLIKEAEAADEKQLEIFCQMTDDWFNY